MLQRLEARAILVRKQDPSDGRRALFRVTPKGRKIDGLRTGTAEALVTKALGKVGAGDLEAAGRVLAAIAENAGARVARGSRFVFRVSLYSTSSFALEGSGGSSPSASQSCASPR